MTEPAIRVQGLSKRYRLGNDPSQRSLRETLEAAMLAPFRRLAGVARRHAEVIWALRGVDFELMPGEILGIVGDNGSGKSTLLKVLSRLTPPTEGRVEIRGRVQSLLEVGVGFQGELTGRENVYLNAAIMGMTDAEIDAKFDEIVAFSEVERFIDTPVKHYSSGMYMRLAFAVAAHFDPDILILDEVLAVGDMAFQRKCLRKMTEVRQSGATVILVSHSMEPITELCTKALWLQNGRIRAFGKPTDVVVKYIREKPDHLVIQTEPEIPQEGSEDTESPEVEPTEVEPLAEPDPTPGRHTWTPPFGKEGVTILSASIQAKGQDRKHLTYTEDFSVVVEYEVGRETEALEVGFDVFNDEGTHVIRATTRDVPAPGLVLGRPGVHRVEAPFPGGRLTPRRYQVQFGILSPPVGHHVYTHHALSFEIENNWLLKYTSHESLHPSVNWIVT